MGERIYPITKHIEKNRRVEVINWLAIAILMVFYAGTWLSPYFYHITEIYNTSIVFVALAILFFNNINWTMELKNKSLDLYLLVFASVIALANLFIIGSHKGCILILVDFLLVWYLCGRISFTRLQMEVMGGVFFFVYLVWFGIDLAFSYNSNTGATVTIFTFFCAMVLLARVSEKTELMGLLIVLAVVRNVNLVLWHLARGAFLALGLFLFFYYIAPKKWWKDKKMYMFLVILSTLGSLGFVLFYVLLAKTGVNFQMPFFYKSLFSGREQIWLEVWNMLKQHLFTGIGSGFELESFFEYNMHNAMYDILAVHGLIVFVLAVVLIVRQLIGIQRSMLACNDTSTMKLKVLAASGIFAIFIESFIDMDLMWADYTPVLLFLLLICFAKE